MSDRYKIDHLLNHLEAAGKRSTPQRHAVCKALVEHGGHPTVAAVFERVRDVFPMISQATVYNTIDTLEELGLIHRFDIATHEHTHYDLDLHPHVNVVCMCCGQITDLHPDSLDVLLDQVSQRTSYEIDRHAALVIYGTCPQCRALQGGDHDDASTHDAHVIHTDKAEAAPADMHRAGRPRRHRRRRAR